MPPRLSSARDSGEKKKTYSCLEIPGLTMFFLTCLLLGFLHLLLVALLCLWLESDGVAKLPVEMDFRRVVELSPPPPSFPSETALDAEVASSADFETFNTNVFGD